MHVGSGLFALGTWFRGGSSSVKFVLDSWEAVVQQVTTMSRAPGFLQGSDCCGPSSPAVSMDALAILAILHVGSG